MFLIIEYGREAIFLTLCAIAFIISFGSSNRFFIRYFKSFSTTYLTLIVLMESWKYLLERKVYSFDINNDGVFSDSEVVGNIDFDFYWKTLTQDNTAISLYHVVGIFYCIIIVIFMDAVACLIKFFKMKLKSK